ncbi:MAG: hypothetical protein V1752_05190 [Candidatus Firestonebacteria bacterium]
MLKKRVLYLLVIAFLFVGIFCVACGKNPFTSIVTSGGNAGTGGGSGTLTIGVGKL